MVFSLLSTLFFLLLGAVSWFSWQDLPHKKNSFFSFWKKFFLDVFQYLKTNITYKSGLKIFILLVFALIVKVVTLLQLHGFWLFLCSVLFFFFPFEKFRVLDQRFFASKFFQEFLFYFLTIESNFWVGSLFSYFFLVMCGISVFVIFFLKTYSAYFFLSLVFYTLLLFYIRLRGSILSLGILSPLDSTPSENVISDLGNIALVPGSEILSRVESFQYFLEKNPNNLRESKIGRNIFVIGSFKSFYKKPLNLSSPKRGMFGGAHMFNGLRAAISSMDTKKALAVCGTIGSSALVSGFFWDANETAKAYNSDKLMRIRERRRKLEDLWLEEDFLRFNESAQQSLTNALNKLDVMERELLSYVNATMLRALKGPSFLSFEGIDAEIRNLYQQKAAYSTMCNRIAFLEREIESETFLYKGMVNQHFENMKLINSWNLGWSGFFFGKKPLLGEIPQKPSALQELEDEYYFLKHRVLFQPTLKAIESRPLISCIKEESFIQEIITPIRDIFS